MKPLASDETRCPACGFVQADYTAKSHQLPNGTLLSDRYAVGMVLGEGGFGITYVGLDTRLGRKIAIKEFYMSGYVSRYNTFSYEVQVSEGATESIFLKNRDRFLDEAKVLASFSEEPGIVGIHDYFLENGTAYIVMEFLDGITLKEQLKQTGRINWEQTKEIFRPVLNSLNEVHKHGIIHRDISPDNIMLTKRGQVKLLDFGAAREFSQDNGKSLSVILKHGFAPEEQYRSKGQQGPWTDVYALCATMYRCLTGITPDESMERLVDDQLKPPAELCDCPQHVSDALMKGLSLFGKDRWQSEADLLQAFDPHESVVIECSFLGKQSNLDAEYTVYCTPSSEESIILSSSSTEQFPTVDSQPPVTVNAKLADNLTASDLLPVTYADNDNRNNRQIQQKKNYRWYIPCSIVLAVVLGVFIFINSWTGWLTISAKKYYINNGKIATGIVSIDNNQYYFNNNGVLQTGWNLIDGNMYHFGKTGIMHTGWLEFAEKKYYLDANGIMQTGWTTIDNATYYFDENGIMQIGWLEAADNIYYLNADGIMQTNWQTIDGKTCFFNEYGIMEKGLQTIDSNQYYFEDNGELHTGWLNLNGHTYYCSPSKNGAIAKGKWTIGTDHYYFLEDGTMATGNLQESQNILYCMNEKGQFQYSDRTLSQVYCEWATEQVSFLNRAGGPTWSTPQILNNPLENVISLQITVRIEKMDYGKCDGEWQVHIRTLDGAWNRIGFFRVENGTGVFNIEFNEPISLEAFVCTCYEGYNWSGSFYQDITELTYRSHDISAWGPVN